MQTPTDSEAQQAPLSSTISESLLKLMSIELVMPSNHLVFCHPLLLLPESLSVSGCFPLNQLFASGDQNIGASASALILPMSIQGSFPFRLTGVISLLLKDLSSLLQYHSSKASILWCSALFMVQLSQPYMTTGKTIGLTLIVIECYFLGIWTKLQRAYWTPSWALYSNTASPRPSVCCCSSLPLSWPSQNGQIPQVLGLLLKVTLLQKILALFSVIILLTLSSNIFKITYLVMFFWLLPGVWVAYHIIYHCWKLIFPPHLITTNSIFNPWILKE